MSKGSKTDGNRSRKKKKARDKRKWINASKANKIEYEFERLDGIKKQFPKGEFRVADCPETGKPILQAFTYPGENKIEKRWQCLHENGTTHLDDSYDEISTKAYKRKE